MIRICFFFLLTIFAVSTAQAKQGDTLFVVQGDLGFEIPYKVAEEEQLFDIAARFNVPPVVLAKTNKMNYSDKIQIGQIVRVPLGGYNFINQASKAAKGYKPVFYKYREGVNLGLLVRYAGVSYRLFNEWNDLDIEGPAEGQRLFVGWVKVEPKVEKTAKAEEPSIVSQSDTIIQVGRRKKPDIIKPEAGEVPQRKQEEGESMDTSKASPVDTFFAESANKREETGSQALEALYMEQTYQDQGFIEESGTTVFFGNAKASSQQVYYAFHNHAKKGTVLKVINIGNGRYVYAKVIGRIPETRQYHNALIAISAAAKEELAVAGEKIWCQIRYAP